MRTVNRNPIEIDTTVANGSRFYTHNEFDGIVQNKNILGVNQNSFADCKNIYVDETFSLVSRPPLMIEEMPEDITGQLIDLLEYNKDTKIYITKTGNVTSIQVYYVQLNRFETLTTESKYKVSCYDRYIICFKEDGAKVIDVINASDWKDLSTFSTSYNSGVTSGDGTTSYNDELSNNMFSNSRVHHYIYSKDSPVTLPSGLESNVELLTSPSAVEIIESPEVLTDYRVLNYTGIIVDDNDIISAKNGKVLIFKITEMLYSSDDGLTFRSIPYTSNILEHSELYNNPEIFDVGTEMNWGDTILPAQRPVIASLTDDGKYAMIVVHARIGNSGATQHSIWKCELDGEDERWQIFTANIDTAFIEVGHSSIFTRYEILYSNGYNICHFINDTTFVFVVFNSTGSKAFVIYTTPKLNVLNVTVINAPNGKVYTKASDVVINTDKENSPIYNNELAKMRLGSPAPYNHLFNGTNYPSIGEVWSFAVALPMDNSDGNAKIHRYSNVFCKSCYLDDLSLDNIQLFTHSSEKEYGHFRILNVNVYTDYISPDDHYFMALNKCGVWKIKLSHNGNTLTGISVTRPNQYGYTSAVHYMPATDNQLGTNVPLAILETVGTSFVSRYLYRGSSSSSLSNEVAGQLMIYDNSNANRERLIPEAINDTAIDSDTCSHLVGMAPNYEYSDADYTNSSFPTFENDDFDYLRPLVITSYNPIYFVVINNKLYTNKITSSTQIVFEYKTDGNNNYFTKVPTLTYSNDELYLAFDNKLYITQNVRTDGQVKLFLSKDSYHTFNSRISAFATISNTELGIFLESGVNICTRRADENLGIVYTYDRTKLTLGIREGDSVVNTIDGAYTIFPTARGLAIMGGQEYMATTEQSLTFISNTIEDLWKVFYLSSTAIKIIQKGSYLFIINGMKEYLMLDLRKMSWWRFEVPVNVKNMITNQIDLFIISDTLYKFSDEYSVYKDFGNRVIEWLMTSQRLHFNAPNHYKNIKQLIFQLYAKNETESTIIAQVKLYRKAIDYRDPEVISFSIEEYNTFVKRFNYWKINELQYGLSNNSQNFSQTRFTINCLSVKYEIGEEVR